MSDPSEPKPSISRRLVGKVGTPYPRPTSRADEDREALLDGSEAEDVSLSPSKRQLPRAFDEGQAHCHRIPKIEPVTLETLVTLQEQREQELPSMLVVPSVAVVPAKPGFPKPKGPVVVPARPEEDLAKGRPVVMPPPPKPGAPSDKVDWFYHVSPCVALASCTPKSWPQTPPASSKTLTQTAPEKSEQSPRSPLSEYESETEMDLGLDGPGLGVEAKEEFEEIAVEEQEEDDWRLLPDH